MASKQTRLSDATPPIGLAGIGLNQHELEVVENLVLGWHMVQVDKRLDYNTNNIS